MIDAAGAPTGGPGSSVPPASVPLGFLAAAGVGLVGFGLGAALAARHAVRSPTLPGVVSAVHVGVLAFLTTAVLGALHQFAPVIGRRPLRSIRAARLTLIAIVGAGWLLPTGFAHGYDALVIAGGLLGVTAVALALWNLSAPLWSGQGGRTIVGLRLSLAYLAVTVSFGIVYAFDRQSGWFPLLPHRVLAHAHLGLIGWLGLTYIAVAEKLWPMFLLAHRPRSRAGAWAVGLVAAGIALLAPGLLFAVKPLATIGGAVVCGGFAAHLTSLAGAIRHRRRPLERLHAYLLSSAVFLVAAVGLGIAAGLAPVSTVVRVRLCAAEVAALVGWLALAVVGHAHKIVPFIAYSSLRARGVRTNRHGGPLLFADLFDHRVATLSLVLGTAGFAAVEVGLASGTAWLFAAGALAVALTGVCTTLNLALGPRRAAQASMAPAPSLTRLDMEGST